MHRSSQRGFAYVVVLFALAVVGAGLAAAGTSWSEARRREAEADLLRIGLLYAQAIAEYYRNSPGTDRTYPRELADLTEDRRHTGTRRYLRDLYPDPITGLKDWGVIRAHDGGIQGVFSTSDAAPLKKTVFEHQAVKLAPASTYRDWRFVAPATAETAR